MLTRTFKGNEYRVTVLDAGFRFDGKDWRSLAGIALHVTGYAAVIGSAWSAIADRGTSATGRARKGDAAEKPTTAETATI